ncbi:MAG: hypothetical protein AAB306_03725 [Pseudomonadota bacterium]
MKQLSGIVIFLSFSILSASVSAEKIQHLQQRTSFAYEQMMQAKLEAELLTKDIAIAEKKLASLKQKLSAAEQEMEAIKRKSAQANARVEQATNKWRQESDTLANEWRQTERK